MEFSELVRKSRTSGVPVYSGTLLSLDPGHTTGYAIFKDLELIESGQLDTKEQEEWINTLKPLFQKHRYTEVVFEDYRVYKWRVQQHAHSELHTSKLIGAIQAVCLYEGLTYHKQPASVAKDFCNDQKLREWGFYVEGQRHARDAIRHGCYFIMFGEKSQWPQKRRSKGKSVG